MEEILKDIINACSKINNQYIKYNLQDKEETIKCKIDSNHIILTELCNNKNIRFFISDNLVDRLLINDDGKFNIYVRPFNEINKTFVSKFKVYKYANNFIREVHLNACCYYTNFNNEKKCTLQYIIKGIVYHKNID